ncbi:MAG: hypothetical protein UU16_C0033G0018 [Candidatus Woesebacteria bacterium GW2011_GWA2_40_7]|uniref:Uncharacterized protein n=3 Tax=Candidatus Woeseibacteriota TaxID=1752722 RepID=A0A0G0XXF0_9BACT|nr:MAG: hypothetical protein UT17_C0002G0062 [Candidatus Woesebacteria bacterium GW2011_GWB1_39_10]KKR73022.1 MAG: hypothetical protein UU16_C0033G0018 [Candidatus Woesebacteria bacterium GW2011_GWA2_40_7]KKR92587.1 MAG: hypothetical protein UU42_C0001G0191 [Candidatus Woesebacteria bacterium GW2011_GWA1_41_13b]
MERVNYYDISANQKLSSLSGDEVEVDDLSKLKKSEEPALFESNGLLQNIGSLDFDPLGIKKPSRWERAVATMIYVISDQIPNREEVKKGRQIIERLPKIIKKNIDKQFVLGFLPYLLSGFNFHLNKNFVADSNFIDDGVSFITKIYKEPSIRIQSFLCAHRESHKIRELSLRDHIHKIKIVRALNLEVGLLVNAGVDKLTIDWYQQTATKRASSNMFPEIFIHYLKTGRLAELVKTLDLHEAEMKILMKNTSTEAVDINLLSLDSFTSQVEEFLENRYGPRWGLLRSIPNENDQLSKIVSQIAMPEIGRLMPFYENSGREKKELQKYLDTNLQGVKDKDGEFAIGDIFKWFVDSQQMTQFGKALYETAFYYFWGYESAEKGIVGIGIDRDHESYQYTAYKKGYYEKTTIKDLNFSIPIVYARRIDTENPKGILRDFSIRQFWRDIN